MNTELQHSEVILHDGGATFAFKPVGNAHTQIMLERIVREDGALRYIRGQEIGPFGNVSLEAQGIEELKREWQEVAEAMVKEAYQCIAFAEGLNPDYWQGKIRDLRKVPLMQNRDALKSKEKGGPNATRLKKK